MRFGWKLSFFSSAFPPASGFHRRQPSWRWVAILCYEPTTWRRKLWAGGNMKGSLSTFHTVEPPDHPGPTTFRVLLHERTISSCCVYATNTSCNWYGKQKDIQQYANCPPPSALLHRWTGPSFSWTVPRLLLPLCCSLILFPDSSSLH